MNNRHWLIIDVLIVNTVWTTVLLLSLIKMNLDYEVAVMIEIYILK